MVIDSIEHERLKAALATRFAMIKSNAEMHKAAADFYKQLALDMSQVRAAGIGYLAAPPTIIQASAHMGGDSYSAERSPGAAVGKSNRATIEGSRVSIESHEAGDSQVVLLAELIGLLKNSRLDNKEDAIRYLSNVKEEIDGERPPDAGLVTKFLDKAKSALAVAEKGSDIWKKANEVLGLFRMEGLT